MSRSIREYWQEIRTLEGTLPEFVWLVCVAANSPEFVTEAPALLAARLLQAKSHRRATNEEVEAHQAREAEAVKQARHERMRRSGAAIVVVEETPEAAVKSEPSPRLRR